MGEIVGGGQTFGDFEGGAGDDGVGGVGAAGPALAAVRCQWLMGLIFMRDQKGVCRSYSMQWQRAVMSALPVYSVVISPHMHCPFTILSVISVVRVVESSRKLGSTQCSQIFKSVHATFPLLVLIPMSK
jgi:hypothetical protein